MLQFTVFASSLGAHGAPVKLISNYYKLNSKPGSQLYQYHVEFNPPQDSRRLREGLVGSHAHLFPIYLFDGVQLFTPTLLMDKVNPILTKKFQHLWCIISTVLMSILALEPNKIRVLIRYAKARVTNTPDRPLRHSPHTSYILHYEQVWKVKMCKALEAVVS